MPISEGVAINTVKELQQAKTCMSALLEGAEKEASAKPNAQPQQASVV